MWCQRSRWRALRGYRWNVPFVSNLQVPRCRCSASLTGLRWHLGCWLRGASRGRLLWLVIMSWPRLRQRCWASWRCVRVLRCRHCNRFADVQWRLPGKRRRCSNPGFRRNARPLGRRGAQPAGRGLQCRRWRRRAGCIGRRVARRVRPLCGHWRSFALGPLRSFGPS